MNRSRSTLASSSLVALFAAGCTVSEPTRPRAEQTTRASSPSPASAAASHATTMDTAPSAPTMAGRAEGGIAIVPTLSGGRAQPKAIGGLVVTPKKAGRKDHKPASHLGRL